MMNLPVEISRKFFRWLSNSDYRSFKFTTRHVSTLLASLQIRNTNIWAKVFFNSCAADRALENGVDLALIGRLHDIGNKATKDKPYLLLVTIPTNATEWQQQARILPFLRGKLKHNSRTGESTFDFPEFIVNIEGVYNFGRDIPLPEAYLSQFTSEETSILYYSQNFPLSVQKERCDDLHGYGQTMLIKIDDVKTIQLHFTPPSGEITGQIAAITTIVV